MPLEYNFILLTESDLQQKPGLTQHASQVQHSNQTVHLMDLDPSYGFLIE
jgi:hypothetical protein